MKKQKQSLTPAASVPLEKGQKIEGQYLDYVKNGELHRINATLIDANGCLYNQTINDSTFDLILFLETGWKVLGKPKVLHVYNATKFNTQFIINYIQRCGIKLNRLSAFDPVHKEQVETFLRLVKEEK
ncbi:MAG: hypothetical protein ACE5IR_08370 [bacterium]